MNKDNPRERYGFINMPMPADLRDELKHHAVSNNVMMHELATEYLRDILRDKWRPPHERRTVQVCVKLTEQELEQMKELAASCNLSVARYVRKYYQRGIINPKHASNARH